MYCLRACRAHRTTTLMLPPAILPYGSSGVKGLYTNQDWQAYAGRVDAAGSDCSAQRASRAVSADASRSSAKREDWFKMAQSLRCRCLSTERYRGPADIDGGE